MTADLACTAGNDRCVIGQFVKFESIDSWRRLLARAQIFGTADIKLIK